MTSRTAILTLLLVAVAASCDQPDDSSARPSRAAETFAGYPREEDPDSLKMMEAHDDFYRLKEALDNASAVSIKYTHNCTVSEEGRITLDHVISGTMLFKSGDRVYISEKSKATGKGAVATFDRLLVSDGSMMSVRYKALGTAVIEETPKHLTPFLKGALLESRLDDVPQLMSLIAVKRLYLGGDAVLGFPSKHFESIRSEGAAKILNYSYTVGYNPPQQAIVKLWYEPESRKLLKRVSVVPDDGTTRIVEEVFTEFTLNADIPDESFKLPESK